MRIDQILRKWMDRSEDEVKRLMPIADEVNQLEAEIEKLSNEELRAKTDEFRKRLADGEDLDDVLPEAFACVREASKRTLHMRHFDVQVVGAIVLHEGKIAEMRTGEGKTLAAVMPLYLNALTGSGAHLVTVNDYLARRDAVWMGPIYHLLGLSVGIIQGQSPESDELGGSYRYEPGAEHPDPRYMNLVECARREAYECDIVYGTNHEFGFDYMRDNMAMDVSQLSMRELNYAVVDEVDSILIDEARTPHIISGPSTEPIEIYKEVDVVARRLKSAKEEAPGIHYTVDKKNHSANLTEEGYDKVEELLGLDNLADDPDRMHYVNAAVKAYGLFDKDIEYVVRDGQVVLVDENTGRLMYGRRLSDGLHQALEAKEGVQVQRESQTVAVITFQNLFRMYDKLAGMTGTAKTEEDEFRKIYGLEVVVVPTNQPMIRIGHPDVVFKSEEAKFRAIAKEILRVYTKQQPVLVGTRSIEMSERISKRLTPDKLQLMVLADRIKQAIENEKGASKKEKNEAYKAILTPIGEAKQKTFASVAKSMNLPSDPLGDEMADWLLKQFDLPKENREYLDEALRHGVPHKILNAKYHEAEAVILAEAGRKGAVTIATNMAGRGVDIVLGGRVKTDEIERAAGSTEGFASETYASFRRGGKERSAPPLPLDEQERSDLADEVRKLDGVYILGTERHESRRIDNQLRGRSGRQGDPGENRYFVSLEDQLWKIFNAKMLENPLLKAWPELEEVNARFLSSMIEKTQKRIEMHFFEYRKHVLEYDDVLNAQREHIYGMRREFLLGKEPRPAIREYVTEAIKQIVQSQAPDGIEETEWDYHALFREVLGVFPAMDYGSPEDLEKTKEPHEIAQIISAWAEKAYEDRIQEIGEEEFEQLEKLIVLQGITEKWTHHLQQVERLREGIGLRGYGQIDPLIAFRKESHWIFEDTLNDIRDFVATHIYRVQLQRRAEAPRPKMQRIDGQPTRTAASAAAQQDGEIDWSKVKRNEPCPCGSGKKFKHCHYRLINQ
ncbi:MAG: SEC-C domain-containing protein [Armatimonadetes bacterium]|nr:SEC-C domain-containing protein [Armatimonadota bacterium]